MVDFIKASAPVFENGIIIIEHPHRGQKRTWAARDDADLMVKVQQDHTFNAWAETNLEPNGAIEISDAEEFIRHDLSRAQFIRFADLDAEYLTDLSEEGAFAKCLIQLGWATPKADDEAEVA